MLGKIQQCLHRWLRRPYTMRIDTLRGLSYADSDDLILHACFQCLADFIEMLDAGRVKWSATEAQEQAWIEIQQLYRWWRCDRPARKDPLLDKNLIAPDNLFEFFKKKPEKMTPQELLFQKALDDSENLDCLWRHEDQEMLLRLIRVRHYLWA